MSADKQQGDPMGYESFCIDYKDNFASLASKINPADLSFTNTLSGDLFAKDIEDQKSEDDQSEESEVLRKRDQKSLTKSKPTPKSKLYY
jgi:hypothetical protein